MIPVSQRLEVKILRMIVQDLRCLTSAEPFHLCRYTCRGLFEVHKLLFSFQMCVKILEAAGKLNMTEYYFFLRGGIVRKTQEFEFEGPMFCPSSPNSSHQFIPAQTTSNQEHFSQCALQDLAPAWRSAEG